MQLVLLGAGKGTRFGGYKQFEPVGPNGECIAHYTVFDALSADSDTEVIFVIKRIHEAAFATHFAPLIPSSISVQVAYQDETGPRLPDGTSIEGSLAAVYSARHLISDRFCIANADDLYGRTGISDLIQVASHLRPGWGVAVPYQVGRTLSPHVGVSRASCITLGDGTLQKVTEVIDVQSVDGVISGFTLEGERVEYNPTQGVSMNLWGFHRSIFNDIEPILTGFDPGEELGIPQTVEKLRIDGKLNVKVKVTDSEWIGMTIRNDFPIVQDWVANKCATGQYPSPLFEAR